MGARSSITSALKTVRVERQTGEAKKGFTISTAIIGFEKAIKEVSKFEIQARFRIQPVIGGFQIRSDKAIFLDATFHVWKDNVELKLYCKNPTQELKDFVSFAINEVKEQIKIQRRTDKASASSKSQADDLQKRA